MGRKPYSTSSGAAQKFRLLLAKAWHAACLTEEEDHGHPKEWTREELDEILVELLERFARDPEKVGSYFKKISLASWMLTGSRLDMIRTEFGMAYIWRRDGQMPAGLMAHYCRIANGFAIPVFDMMRVAGLENFDESELVDAIGADAGLTAIVLCRLAVYQTYHTSEERSYFLGALHRIEQAIAEKRDTPIGELYDPLIEKILPPPE